MDWPHYLSLRKWISVIPKMLKSFPFLLNLSFFLQQRRLLYELFNKNYRIRRTMIQAKLTQELGDACKADVDRMLNVSNHWIDYFLTTMHHWGPFLLFICSLVNAYGIHFNGWTFSFFLILEVQLSSFLNKSIVNCAAKIQLLRPLRTRIS